MKYIPLVALSAFLFACSQESSTGTEASIIEEQLQNGSTALVEESEDDVALTKRSYYTADFSASRTVTQFPVRMIASTSIEKKYKADGSCKEMKGLVKTEVLVYDSKQKTMVPYSKPHIESHIYPVKKSQLNQYYNNAGVSTNQGDNKAEVEHYSTCTNNLAFIGVHRIIHGKDTVLITTSKGFDTEATASTYYDRFIKSFWTR